MFMAIKKALGVHTADNLDYPYYLTRYFHCQVVVWLVQNQQGVWLNEHVALEYNYGFEETTPSFKGPLTYKSYCRVLLNKKFWGDKVVLYAVSCLWNLQIMVFNSHTDQEYRIHHSAIMDQVDVNLILNGGMHYSAGGR